MTSTDGSASTASSRSATYGQPWWHDDPAPDSGRTSGSTSESTEALVGAAAAEFVKLAGSVTQWADRTGVNATLKSFVDQAAQAAQALGTDARCDQRVCNVCPICQGMAALSAARPELADSLIEVMTAMSELVHAVAETLVAGPSSD